MRMWVDESELPPMPDDPAAMKVWMPRWMTKTARTSEERAIMLRDRFFYSGYHDARADRGYCEDYDSWQEPHQLVYQCGRAMISFMRSEGVTPPEWPDRLDCEEPLAWLNDRRRRFPDELLLPKRSGRN